MQNVSRSFLWQNFIQIEQCNWRDVLFAILGRESDKQTWKFAGRARTRKWMQNTQEKKKQFEVICLPKLYSSFCFYNRLILLLRNRCTKKDMNSQKKITCFQRYLNDIWICDEAPIIFKWSLLTLGLTRKGGCPPFTRGFYQQLPFSAAVRISLRHTLAEFCWESVAMAMRSDVINTMSRHFN